MEPDLNVHFIAMERGLKRNRSCVLAFSENLEKLFRDLKRLYKFGVAFIARGFLLEFFDTKNSAARIRAYTFPFHSVRAIALFLERRDPPAHARDLSRIFSCLSHQSSDGTFCAPRTLCMCVDAPSRKHGRVGAPVIGRGTSSRDSNTWYQLNTSQK